MNRFGLTLLTLVLTTAAGAQTPSPEPSTRPAATPEENLAPAVDTSAPKAEEPAPAPTPAPAPVADKAAKSPLSAPGAEAAGGNSRSGKSNDRLELGTTEISGNRELPKVLYVVPWRRPEIGDAVGRPPNSLVEEALTPVDRDVFRRQNRYYAALEAGAAPAKSQPAAAGGASAHAARKDEK